MAEADAIARRALELAQARLDRETMEIADLAQGDSEALFQAAEMVHIQTAPRAKAHIAFSLIAAAFDSLRASRPDPQQSPPPQTVRYEDMAKTPSGPRD